MICFVYSLLKTALVARANLPPRSLCHALPSSPPSAPYFLLAFAEEKEHAISNPHAQYTHRRAISESAIHRDTLQGFTKNFRHVPFLRALFFPPQLLFFPTPVPTFSSFKANSSKLLFCLLFRCFARAVTSPFLLTTFPGFVFFFSFLTAESSAKKTRL